MIKVNLTRWIRFSEVLREHTKLTQVQAEVGSLHQAGVLTHGPNIEVHEDGQAGEGRHSEPHQEEQVGQEHQLQTHRRATHDWGASVQESQRQEASSDGI